MFCILLSILFCGIYPVSSNDEGKEDDNQKPKEDQTQEIFKKYFDILKDGFKKSMDNVHKAAEDSWTALGDTAKKGTEHALKTMDEMREEIMKLVDEAMGKGYSNFEKMMGKA